MEHEPGGKTPRSDPDTSLTLVTGGSGGIGSAVVRELAARGQAVAFTFCSSEGRALALEEETGSLALALDLVDKRGPERIVRAVEERLGPLTGLVNNAGIRREGILGLMSNQAWEEVIDVNLGGAFRCCRAVLRGMVHRRRGSIVNVASLAAERGVAGLSSYAASKAGMLAMTRCLAREVGKRGVRVNAIVPGFVDTGMTEGLPERAMGQLRAAECLPAGTSAADVGRAVAFLLSDESTAVTGQTIRIDAGASA